MAGTGRDSRDPPVEDHNKGGEVAGVLQRLIGFAGRIQ